MKINSGFIVVLLFLSSHGWSQTTFTEQAAAHNIDLRGTKDGGLTFADFNNDSYLDLLVNTNDWGNGFRSHLYCNSGPPNYTYVDVTLSNAAGLSKDVLDGDCAFVTDVDGCPDGIVRQSTPQDLDNDGIFNFCDLDNDDDGCSDAEEGETSDIPNINNTEVSNAYTDLSSLAGNCGRVIYVDG